MSEDELDKVIWQESHAATEREQHIDRLKELTGLDYGDFEGELEKKDQYAAMLWSSRDTAREECDAALERAEAAVAFIASHVTDSFTRYVPLNRVFQCRVCEKYSNRALHRDAVVHEEDCALVAILATTLIPTEEVKP